MSIRVNIAVTASVEWANYTRLVQALEQSGLAADEIAAAADRQTTHEMKRMQAALAWAYNVALTKGADAEVTLHHGDVAGGERYAAQVWSRHGLPVHKWPTDREQFGWPRAGFERNEAMIASRPDVVLAFQIDRSVGVEQVVSLAVAADIPVFLWQEIDGQDVEVVTVTHENIMDIYPRRGEGITRYESAMRKGTPLPVSVPPTYYDATSGIERCGECGKPVHVGFCASVEQPV